MSNNEDYAADLAVFDKDYEKIEPAEKKEFDPVPNGRYQAAIDKAYMGKSKNSGELMLTLELVVIAGQFKNRRLFRHNMIATSENLRWLKGDLKTIGIVLGKTSDLPGRLNEFLDIVVDVTVKNYKENDKDYQNVYLNKKLDIDLPEEFKAENAGKNVALDF